MNTVAVVALAYLLAGIAVLVVFDFATKRIRTRLSPAVDETQVKIAGANPFLGRGMASYVSRKTAFIAIVIAMWLFWPVVLYGYVESKLKRRDNADKIQR